MKQHIIKSSESILSALQMLNALSGSSMTLFVVDEAERLIGTVTDGDIRRAILAGRLPSDSVTLAMHRQFRAYTDETTALELRRMRRLGVNLLPHINSDGTIRAIIDLGRVASILPLSAILMAGGKGERLRPMTLNTPKPLLEVGGKAIIDYNVEMLAANGISDIWVTTNYLADRIEEHFSHPVAGVNVKCVRESSPLGTLGSAALADLPAEGFTLVMNSDLLTSISLEDMYIHHVSTGADITVAVIPYQVSIPYAILDVVSERVTGLQEKPTMSYYANAGIYIFPNSMLRGLQGRVDATDCITEAIEHGRNVTYFPVNGLWMDIGSPVDFKQANDLMRNISLMNPRHS